MASVIIISPRGSLGITASHRVISDMLSRHVDGVRHITGLSEVLGLATTLKVFIFPVHYFLIALALKSIGKKVFFVCHGRPHRSHYSRTRFWLLRFFIGMSERLSDLSIYVSKKTRGKSGGVIFHNLENDYIFRISEAVGGNIIFFGRVDRAKGIEELFSVIDSVNRRRRCPFKLFIAGKVTADFAPAFEGLLSRFRFADYLGQYSTFDELVSRLGSRKGLFISLNFTEPFGIVYLESLKLGLLPLIPLESGFAEVCHGAPLVSSIAEVEAFLLSTDLHEISRDVYVSVADDREIVLKSVKEICGFS